jgi:hypothetical protein
LNDEDQIRRNGVWSFVALRKEEEL